MNNTYEYEFEKKKLKNYVGNELYNVLKAYDCYIAGGSILSIFSNTEINDLDVYFRNKADLADFLYNDVEGYHIISHTDKAFSFRVDEKVVQAIYFKYFESAEDIFKTFDFTVCMAAYDFKTEKFVLHKDFLKHNVNRILKFNSDTVFPIISALRIDKYKKKGFSISKAEFIRIMLTIMMLNISSYEELKEQIGGMYGENYDKIIKPEDNEEFNLVNVIEKISNMSINDDYFEGPGERKEIPDWDDFVYSVIKEPIKYFVHRNTNYRISKDEFKRVNRKAEEDKDKYHLVAIEDVLPLPIYRYKWVNKKEDGTYWSFYDASFEWKIGENTPKGFNPSLYAAKKEHIGSCSYNDKAGKCLLEIKINNIDDIKNLYDYNRKTLSLNKATVTREVPESEYEDIIKANKDSVKPVINSPFNPW